MHSNRKHRHAKRARVIFLCVIGAFIELFTVMINPFSAKDVLIDFTLSNARRFYSSKGDPLALKGLTKLSPLSFLVATYSKKETGNL